MTVFPFAGPGTLLAVANAIVSLVIWQIVTVDPPPRKSDYSVPTTFASVELMFPVFNKVLRRDDPAAERLFGLPTTQISTLPNAAGAFQDNEPAIRLVGVVMVEGTDNERIALIEHGQPARITRSRVGAQQDLLGWRIEEISSSSVELRRGKDHLTLNLN